MTEGRGLKITGKEALRKIRSDRKVKVCPYFTQNEYDKLNKLSRACNITPAALILSTMEYILNNPNAVTWLQDKHGVKADDHFRITPVIENGRVIY